MTTAQRPARALVDRRRCDGLSLSGSPSGLAGIVTLLRSARLGSRHDINVASVQISHTEPALTFPRLR
jgi:hypothetical protein